MKEIKRDRKIKSFCELFEQKRNYKSHIVYIYIQDFVFVISTLPHII